MLKIIPGAAMPQKEFKKLVGLMKRLRIECPWDNQQTHQSLRQYLLEETYETLDALDSQNDEELKSELGDLLLQIVFHAEIAEERDAFDMEEIIRKINEKLIRRHPHVFGNVKVNNADDVVANWEKIKRQEGRASVLDGTPEQTPALIRAQRLQNKASKVGFDWTAIEYVQEKIEEEWRELCDAVKLSDREKCEEEFGDLLFSMINLARFLEFNAEDALRKTIKKFIRRFKYIETQLEKLGKSPESTSLEKMDSLWNEAKQIE